MNVLITRSEPGASELADALMARGVNVLVCPLLDIVELDPWQTLRFDDSEWVTAPLTAQRPVVSITLSVHAADILSQSEFLSERSWLKNVPSIAVGNRTAKVLKQAGFQPRTPDIPSSEGIIQMPMFDDADAWHKGSFWVFSGVGGRDLIAAHFSTRLKARVCKIAVYERINVTPANWDVATITHVVLASEQTLRHFAKLWRDDHGSFNVVLVLPSQRLAEIASSLGFTKLVNAHAADSNAMVDVICRMEQKSDE